MNFKKIGLFLAIAYSISWAVALAMYLLKIPYGTVYAQLIVGALYMTAPAVAVLLLQKTTYMADLQADYGLVWRNINYRQLLLVPAFFILLLVIMFLSVYLLGNILGISTMGVVEFSELSVKYRMAQITGQAGMDIGKPLPVPPIVLLFGGIISAMIAGCTVNLLFAMGEELGWRGLLLRETRALGFWKSNLFIGFLWGLWHAPVILLGHNYKNYPGFGMGMMILLCIAWSFMFSYLRDKTQTLLAPAMLHGMINGVGGLLPLYIVGGNELWTSPAGVIGILAGLTLLLGIILFDRDYIKNFTKN